MITTCGVSTVGKPPPTGTSTYWPVRTETFKKGAQTIKGITNAEGKPNKGDVETSLPKSTTTTPRIS
jgi:hypothetical protein